MVGMGFLNVLGDLVSKNGFGVNLKSQNNKLNVKIHRLCLYTECLQGSLHCHDEAMKDPCELKFMFFPNESISPPELFILLCLQKGFCLKYIQIIHHCHGIRSRPYNVRWRGIKWHWSMVNWRWIFVSRLFSKSRGFRRSTCVSIQFRR